MKRQTLQIQRSSDYRCHRPNCVGEPHNRPDHPTATLRLLLAGRLSLVFDEHGGGTVNPLAKQVFNLGSAIRYVPTYARGHLELNQRGGVSGASASESDRYEELLVNPTLLTLLSQRGDIDCGGLRYILVRYGNFFQLVAGIPDGHISVALEPTADLDLVERVRAVITAHADTLSR